MDSELAPRAGTQGRSVLRQEEMGTWSQGCSPPGEEQVDLGRRRQHTPSDGRTWDHHEKMLPNDRQALPSPAPRRARAHLMQTRMN